MHIDYLRRLGPDGELEEIEMINFEACCDEMEKHILAGTISFGQRTEEVYRNKSFDLFVRVENGRQIIANDGNAPKEGGIAHRVPTAKPNTDIALAYCPWCTKPVETHEIAIVPCLQYVT